MKEPKNIVLLNNIATYYISLNGIQGKMVSEYNPIADYFEQISDITNDQVLEYNNSSIDEIEVDDELYINIIEVAYDLYKEVDILQINQDMKEEIMNQLGDTNDFEKYVETSKEIYKNSFYEVVSNINSDDMTYNNIKINMFNDILAECVRVEDYNKAATIKNLIGEFNTKYNM